MAGRHPQEGRLISALFQRPGGDLLRERIESIPNEGYQRMLWVGSSEIAERIMGADAHRSSNRLLQLLPTPHPAAVERNLGGHDLGLLVDTFESITTTGRPWSSCTP